MYGRCVYWILGLKSAINTWFIWEPSLESNYFLPWTTEFRTFAKVHSQYQQSDTSLLQPLRISFNWAKKSSHCSTTKSLNHPKLVLGGFPAWFCCLLVLNGLWPLVSIGKQLAKQENQLNQLKPEKTCFCFQQCRLNLTLKIDVDQKLGVQDIVCHWNCINPAE